MPKKKRMPELDRYLAMRKRVEAKPKRTIGDLLRMYRETKEVALAACARMTEILDKVYRGEVDPPDTGRWNAWPRYRRLYHPTENGHIRMYDFGWSHKTNHIGGGYWVRSWTSNGYDGVNDIQCVMAILGRRPAGALDEMASTIAVAEALADNDEALAQEFEASYLRSVGTRNRMEVVERKIEETVTRHLAETQNWAADERMPWRRITFADGTILTVTDRGKVIHGDALVDMTMPMDHPAVVREAPFPNSLAERQKRAREGK